VTQHPLDHLDADEITAAVATLRADGADVTSFRLVPFGFFDRNPALAAPPSP
jgi:Cu2+-containing amine oxidase